ncbi:MAG: DUF1080 domain-containing protein [Planctomycetota bacterium]|nr:DUF1080 domain-containing protein [Planctomycetota bacterium]
MIRMLSVPFMLFFAVSLECRADELASNLLAGEPTQVFRKVDPAWHSVQAVTLDPANPRKLTIEAGKGVWTNAPKGTAQDLYTTREYGDVAVEIEFLIPQRSNSGIKLMGLYEVQITDSHGKTKMTGSECGGIYPRAELLPKYRHLDEGIAPKSNACGKPGEWQKLEIAFHAAKHEGEGKDRKKIANARFDRVVLNGTVIHENLEVSSPTGHNWTKVEPAKGPLMLQLDHGPVAVRKFMARDLGK